ncbi:MAG: helix-turn-helix domain-containing protein [Balneolaceae bacterium]
MSKHVGDLTLYSIDDLHELLGVSKVTLRMYLREGKLRGRKLGVKWFVTEEALRDYFNGESASSDRSRVKASPGRLYRYRIEGVNDLVSEKEECDTLKEAIGCIESQAIISLFQVAILDSESGEVIELVKARDFLDRHI